MYFNFELDLVYFSIYEVEAKVKIWNSFINTQILHRWRCALGVHRVLSGIWGKLAYIYLYIWFFVFYTTVVVIECCGRKVYVLINKFNYNLHDIINKKFESYMLNIDALMTRLLVCSPSWRCVCSLLRSRLSLPLLSRWRPNGRILNIFVFFCVL